MEGLSDDVHVNHLAVSCQKLLGYRTGNRVADGSEIDHAHRHDSGARSGEEYLIGGVNIVGLEVFLNYLDIEVVEEDLQPYDIYTADEVFFSRTSPRIVPVSMVDLRPVGDSVPGPITQQLLAAHSEMVDVDIVGQALHYGGVQG